MPYYARDSATAMSIVVIFGHGPGGLGLEIVRIRLVHQLVRVSLFLKSNSHEYNLSERIQMVILDAFSCINLKCRYHRTLKNNVLGSMSIDQHPLLSSANPNSISSGIHKFAVQWVESKTVSN